LVLGSGRVLIGTERQGLLVFDGRSLTPFHPRLKSAHITALAGNDGDLWIGTLESGVFHYRAGQLEELLAALPDPQVLSLAVAGEMAYAGTPLGVVEFRQGQRQRTLADGFFARALARRGEALHVGTEDEGILEVPLQPRPAPPAAAPLAAPLETDAPFPVLRLANLEGDIYAVGESAIYRYDPSSRRWRPAITAGPSLLADRNVAALALSAGRLWIGYFDRGLDLADTGLEQAVHREDDALFCINRIVADPEHARTAVATANGLVLFDSGAQPRQIMGRKDGLLSDHVTDVAFREGGMVVATPAGLSFVDRSGVRSLYVFHGLVNNHVYTVATHGSQTVAGTLGGLSVLDDDTVRVNYTTANSHLKHNWITALARVGDEWFAGTYGAGVLRLDSSGEWHSFPDLKEGFVVNPNAMTVSGGQVYAGSLDRGLFVFDRASGRWTSTTVGLPSKNVTALAAGGGYLYAGTDNGLVRMAEGALR
jgi:ligand-binding sensor domain-containing protein